MPTVVCVVAILAAALGQHADAESRHANELTGTVRVDELPSAGQTMLKLIESGGPFPYDRDGVVFGNREKIVPLRPHGYYHEYTVKTPGAHNRGARRLVCGGPRRSVDDCYYSDDHYRSFRKVTR